MPVCSQCQRWIDQGGACLHCGANLAEMTAVDARVAPRAGIEPLRPRRRAPVPLLIALDDDSDVEGEVRRLRFAEITIGRRDADWCFANDADMSAVHAKISRLPDDHGAYGWRLLDQGSSNGTFVRVPHVELAHADKVMIGAELMRWENETLKSPQIRVFAGSAESRVVRIRGQQDLTLGSDSTQADIVFHNPTVDARHAVMKHSNGTWRLEDQASRNGVWKQVTEFDLTSETCFILGEQRFLFRLTSRRLPVVPAPIDRGKS